MAPRSGHSCHHPAALTLQKARRTAVLLTRRKSTTVVCVGPEQNSMGRICVPLPTLSPGNTEVGTGSAGAGTAVPAGRMNLGRSSLAELGDGEGTTWAQGGRGWDTHTAHHTQPQIITAAHSIAQRAAPTPVPHRCQCCRQTHCLQLGHGNEALCGDAEQELPIHQSLLLQPVPPAYPIASGSPSPECSGVGLELHSMALRHHGWHSPSAHPHSTPFGLPCEHHEES